MNRTKRKKWDTKTGNLNVQRKRIALNGQLKTRKAAKRWKFRVKKSLEKNIFPFLSPISNQWFERRKKLKRKTFFLSYFLSQAFDLTRFFCLFLIFVVVMRIFDCLRCGADSMINSISVLFPFEYFIPFRPLAIVFQKLIFIFIFFFLSTSARNHSSHNTHTNAHTHKIARYTIT